MNIFRKLRRKKERIIDERFDTQFEKSNPPDILYADWTCVPHIAGEPIHIGQVVTDKDDKLYGADNDDISIGVALYSGNKGDKIAVTYDGVVYCLASKDIKDGEIVRASRKYQTNGFIEPINCWDDEDAIGIAIENISNNTFGRIWLITYSGGYKYWNKYIKEKEGIQ